MDLTLNFLLGRVSQNTILFRNDRTFPNETCLGNAERTCDGEKLSTHQTNVLQCPRKLTAKTKCKKRKENTNIFVTFWQDCTLHRLLFKQAR